MKNLFILMLMWIIIMLIIFSSCNDTNKYYVAGYTDATKICQTTIDSIKTKCDSLQTKYNEEIVLIKLTKLQCQKYATVVQKNPTQSVFIVGWVNRAFEGTIPQEK